jgi:hypothetical protein
MRGIHAPSNQLLMAAHETVLCSVLAAEVFERPIAIPRWISDQLIHYRHNPLPDRL